MNVSPMTRRRAIQAGTLATGAALLPGIRATGAQDVVEITFWNALYSTEDPNDKTRPLEDFYIYQAINRFQEAKPGIQVAMENVPGDPTMFTKYRTASVAQNGPDVMGMWSGTYMLNLKDFLEPLGPYFSAEERALLTGWEAVTEDFNSDSPDIYGVPGGSDGVTVIFYNRSLLAEAGVVPDDAWPADVTEFFAMLEAVASTGTTPLVLENNGYIWHVLLYWLGQTVGGSEGINALTLGERNFSDPDLVNIVTQWQGLYDYTIPGAETMEGSQASQLFGNREAAMTTGGFWIIGDAQELLGDDLGMIKLPDFSSDAAITDGGIGGPGTALIVSNYSAHKDAAVSFIKFLTSEEEQITKATSGDGSLLNLATLDAEALYDEPMMVMQQQWATEPSTIFWPDNTFPAELTTEIKAQSQLAWTGEIDATEFMSRLDAKRDELLDS